MQSFVTIFVTKIVVEYHHFLALSQAARRLLLSFSFFELVEPLIFSFINAFILRQTDSFISVVIYNVGQFVFIPLFFYINGVLLKYVSLKKLYLTGLLGQGLGLLIVFFVPITGLVQLCLFGCFLGAMIGLYWANRNFMTLEITSDSTRTYFTGLEQITFIAAGLIVPLLIGAVIKIGGLTAWYSAEAAYQGLGVASLLLLALAGKVLGVAQVDNPKLHYLLVTKPTWEWWYVRLAEVSYGVFHGGQMFLPTLLVFTLLGEEATLGSLQSVAAFFTAFVIYYFSRKLQPHQRLGLTIAVMTVLLVISLALSVFFTGLVAVVLLVLLSPINNMRWLAWSPTVLRAIDAQDGGDPTNNYAYIVDREIFLNIGRLVGLAFFVAMITYFSERVAVRFQPLVIALFQLLFIVAMYKVATARALLNPKKP